ncbi:MAG: hypothetical protein H0U63_08470 [Burkholderiales bacterium]|nr:hypothetical protein [Burkholderiales bacterium]
MAEPINAQEMFEMFQRMMNPTAFPMQSLLFPSLSKEEIERKISELKNVESWLAANLSMLQISIKTMQYQRSLLAGGDGAQSGEKPENPFTNPALWPWNMMAAGATSRPDEAPNSDDKNEKK